MALKRKAQPLRKRLGVKRRRFARKARVPRSLSGKLLIKRTFYAGNWTFGTATTNDFWRYGVITLNNLPSVAELANVFDEFKINAIKVTYRPAYDSVASDASALSVSTAPQAYAHIIVDPATTVIPSGVYGSSTLNTFLENDRVRTVTLNRPFSIYWKPMVRGEVDGAGTASEMRKPRYIRTDATSRAAVFTGYHMYIQQNNFATSNTRITLDSYVTLYMTMRNLK